MVAENDNIKWLQKHEGFKNPNLNTKVINNVDKRFCIHQVFENLLNLVLSLYSNYQSVLFVSTWFLSKILASKNINPLVQNVKFKTQKGDTKNYNELCRRANCSTLTIR